MKTRPCDITDLCCELRPKHNIHYLTHRIPISMSAKEIRALSKRDLHDMHRMLSKEIDSRNYRLESCHRWVRDLSDGMVEYLFKKKEKGSADWYALQWEKEARDL